ncbi:MAG: ribosome biogenesis GTPase Der [Erysipelotrichaceae bacterium]|nr:ribosome biogenesis GTPase Der [Erysipelotrichaceae bacterium]
MSKGIVAIVGSPNVGKSTLFNRIIGARHAIVDDQAGITRDRLYGKASWLTKDFTLIDTGGIEIKNAPFQKQIRAQVEIALEEADVILYVADGRVGVTQDDRFVCKMLYKSDKPIILAVNKIDNLEMMANVDEFYSLGIGDPIALSTTHGIGVGDILDKIIELLPERKEKKYENAICFSLIGRPNVGKSSLTNALLGQDRVIVSDIEGTTRDSIDTPFKRDGQDYVVIDTAGLKKRGRIYEAVDKYSALRALSSIDRSDVVLLLIDASVGITNQDKHVVGYALEENKAIVIVVNKWDLVEHTENAMNEFKKKVRNEFKFLDYAPIVFLSAKDRSRIQTLFPEINIAYNSYNFRVGTSVLNDVIADAQIMNPTPVFNGGRLKIYFASQVATCPPTFILSVNNPEFMHFSYQRYIENRLRDSFEFTGTPLKIICRERK